MGEPVYLYGLDEPLIFFTRAVCKSRGAARYHGWHALFEVGMTDEPFDPRAWRVLARYAYRLTADPWAELTHRVTDCPYVPGAFPVWLVEGRAAS